MDPIKLECSPTLILNSSLFISEEVSPVSLPPSPTPLGLNPCNELLVIKKPAVQGLMHFHIFLHFKKFLVVGGARCAVFEVCHPIEKPIPASFFSAKLCSNKSRNFTKLYFPIQQTKDCRTKMMNTTSCNFHKN